MAVTETSKRGKEIVAKAKPKKTSKKPSKKPAKKNDEPKKGNYFAMSYRELKKVTWPSKKESWRLTFAVIVFSATFAGIATLVDYIFRNVIERYII